MRYRHEFAKERERISITLSPALLSDLGQILDFYEDDIDPDGKKYNAGGPSDQDVIRYLIGREAARLRKLTREALTEEER